MIEFERWLDDRRPSAPRRHRGLQRGGLPRDARAARLAARPAARGRGASTASRSRSGRRPSARRRRTSRRGARRDRAPPRRAARAARRRRRAAGSRRGCSSTTAARRARAGGGTSAGCEMTDEELVDDGEALGCLEHDGDGAVDLSIVNARSLEWTFTFPPQQHHFDEGDGGDDPREGGTGWTVTAIDNATGTVALRRGKAMRDERAADGARPGRPVRHEGAAGGAPPARRLAARRATAATRTSSGCSAASLRSAARRCSGCEHRRAARACSTGSTSSYLVVQGPPGSGKTYRGARLITHLLRAGKEGRGHGAEPQGDPQPARRGRATRPAEEGLDFQRRQAGRATYESDARRSRANSTTFARSGGRRSSPARRGSSRARSSTGRSTRS